MVTAIDNIQQRQRSEVFTRIHMILEETMGKRTGPSVEAKCQNDTGTGKMLCQILFSAGCVKQCLTPLGKPLRCLMLTGPQGQHMEVPPLTVRGRAIKCIWNKKGGNLSFTLYMHKAQYY